MSKDEILRDALVRALGAEPPNGDPWGRFRTKQRRALFARGMAVSGVALGAGLVLLFTLPGLNTKQPSSFFNPQLNPSALRHYVDPVVGFQLDYPADWTGSPKPGELAEFSTSPLTAEPSPGRELGTFFPGAGLLVSVGASAEPGTKACRALLAAGGKACGRELYRFDEDAARAREAGAEVTERDASVGGRPTRSFGFVYPPHPEEPSGGYTAGEPLYWCGECRLASFTIRWFDGWTIEIRVAATDAETFDRYLPDALRIVASFARYPA